LGGTGRKESRIVRDIELDGQPAVLSSSPGGNSGKREEEGYRELFQASRDAVVITGLDGVISDVNPACVEMFGLDREKLLGLNFGDFYTNPLDAKRFVQEINKKGWLRDYEVRLKGPEGSHFHALFTVSVRRDSRGREIGYQGIVHDITRRKHDLEKLQASEARYRALFETSSQAFFVMKEGVILDCNSRALDMFACSEEQVLGFPPDQFIPTSQPAGFDSLPRARERFAKALNGAPQQFEVRLQRLDKTLFDAEMELSTFTAGDEKHVLGVVQDITRRKAALQALEDSEQRFRALAHNAPDIIYTLDSAGMFTYINPAWQRILGHSPKEVLGRYFVDFVEPDAAKRYRKIFKLIRDGRQTFVDLDGKLVAKNGTLRDFLLSGSPNVDEDGDVVGMVGLFRDITERNMALRLLRDSEKRHRTVLESAPDPVMVCNRAGKVTYINPAFTRVFGWKLDELSGGEIAFVPPDRRNETHELMDKVLRGETISGIETKRIGKDGTEVDVSLSGAAFLDAQGRTLGMVLTLQDVTDRKRTQEQLRYVAYHDLLTGLPNRKSFYEAIDQAMLQACRLPHDQRHTAQRLWALLFLDLDRFKTINDSLGHDVGDNILQTVASRIKNCLRSSDKIFRLGGDEFTVMLNELSRDIDAARVAEKILDAVAKPIPWKGSDLYLTASIGISVCPNDGTEVEAIVRNADMAMYAAKNENNSYNFYTEEMNAKAQARMRLETSLRRAVQNNELVLYYQPMVDSKHRIQGMEALLRWLHPEIGLVPPAQFISVAEETGAIVPIGRWVLEEACRQAKAWQDGGYDDLYVAVNLSARQFRQPDLVDEVLGILERTGLKPHHLKLEVTESSVMENPEDAIAKMETLSERGIRFSIDDFGTGYSSLSHLKRFPVDTLKIDRSFVAESTENQGDQEIIRTILAMAASLNMKAVAEGVETREQRDFLCHEGCRIMQGFYFGPPLPEKDFEGLLKRGVLGE
jgi:diguanylate cyclase (GGDEF)-like protein/PAS domain S-box-containing protein